MVYFLLVELLYLQHLEVLVLLLRLLSLLGYLMIFHHQLKFFHQDQQYQFQHLVVLLFVLFSLVLIVDHQHQLVPFGFYQLTYHLYILISFWPLNYFGPIAIQFTKKVPVIAIPVVDVLFGLVTL